MAETSVYVESPDDFSRLKPKSNGSLDVNVTNPVTSLSVSGAVAVSNFPSIQAVNGTVSVGSFPSDQLVHQAVPASGDIVRGSLGATGTLYTVPSGRTFYGSVSLSGCIALAGTCAPAVSVGGTDIHKITINGLALTSVASANTISDVYVAGPATITFTAGASGTSTGQIAGRLL